MSIKTFNFVKRKPLTTKEKEEAKKKIAAMREKDNEMVTGIFKNRDGEGKISFSYGKYKEDGTSVYEFNDGGTYTIPRMVANHLNQSTAVPQREYATNPDGTKSLHTVIRKKNKRYEFISTDF